MLDETTAIAAGDALLALNRVTKRYAGVTALDAVDFDVRRGEVHALLGENGAGKSTLINIVAGARSPDAGTFIWNGAAIGGLTPARARTIGISAVFQDFSLVPGLTVEENLFLGREIAWGGLLQNAPMRNRAQALIEKLGFDLPLTAKAGTLSRAHQQMIEIAKALLADLQLLILDEPTASLTEKETERLFQLIDALKADGVGIVYVSHRMREIRRLADRITVLRDGRLVRTVRTCDVDDRELVELMTGRKIEVHFPSIRRSPGKVLLEVDNLTCVDNSVTGVHLQARAGEITGIAGLVGCGKSEVVRAIYGIEPVASGVVVVDGMPYENQTPGGSLDRGIAYFPSDRVTEGLALSRPIRENASMSAMNAGAFSLFGFLDITRERNLVRPMVERLKLRPPNIERAVGDLSGGNRQKVVLARGLLRTTRIFLFDEPTVGIDVGAKLEVYEFMQTLIDAGAAVILVSSELPEVLGLSDPVYVMHQGRIAATLRGHEISEQRVLESFFQVSIPSELARSDGAAA